MRLHEGRKMRAGLLAWGLLLTTACLFALTPLSAAERPATLEDFYGDTGDTFQAAVGMINFEKYGIADLHVRRCGWPPPTSSRVVPCFA